MVLLWSGCSMGIGEFSSFQTFWCFLSRVGVVYHEPRSEWASTNDMRLFVAARGGSSFSFATVDENLVGCRVVLA